MELWHDSTIPVQYPDKPGPFIGLAGRFVDLFPNYGARLTLALAFLIWVGVSLGRKVHTALAGQAVYGNLFAATISPSASNQTMKIVRDFVKPLGSPPLILNSGIKSGVSLVYAIRDSLRRSEKKFTEPHEAPEFADTEVDVGTVERRVLLTQARIDNLLRSHTQASASLRDVLLHAFDGDDLAEFMTFRDGGFLKSSGPHVAVWTTGSYVRLDGDNDVLSDTLLFCHEGDPIFAAVDSPSGNWEAVQALTYARMCHAAGECRLEKDAANTIQKALSALPFSRRRLAAVKVLKLGLIYAILDGQSTIGAAHARAAVSVLRSSEMVRQFCIDEVDRGRIEAVAKRIVEALAVQPNGLTATDVSDLFSGNIERALLDAAKRYLLTQGQATVSPVRTKGRSRMIWKHGGPR